MSPEEQRDREDVLLHEEEDSLEKDLLDLFKAVAATQGLCIQIVHVTQITK